MNYLGSVAHEVRLGLGLTQKQLADELDITTVHLSNIENDKAMPSPGLLNRYQELSGVDLYVMSWLQKGEINKLPEAVQEAAIELQKIWAESVRSQKVGGV